MNASAQYVGSDNFDDNVIGPEWDAEWSWSVGMGTYSNVDGRLQFTSTGTELESRVLVWNLGPNDSYSQDWIARVDVTNLSAPINDYSQVGLEIFNESTSTTLGMFSINLQQWTDGTKRIQFTKGRSADGTNNTLSWWGSNDEVMDVTEVTLIASFAALSKELTLGYSFDGGETLVNSFVFNPSSGDGLSFGSVPYDGAWYAEPLSGFRFQLNSSAADLVGPGVIYADNFSVVAAVPEPSTYAAFLGFAALGAVAFWRRRAMRGMTSARSPD